MAAATAVLIFAGGLVTSTGSGLSVPDWPNTYGWFMFTGKDKLTKLFGLIGIPLALSVHGYTGFILGQMLLAVPIGMALGLQGAMVVEIFPLRTRVTSKDVEAATRGRKAARPARRSAPAHPQAIPIGKSLCYAKPNYSIKGNWSALRPSPLISGVRPCCALRFWFRFYAPYAKHRTRLLDFRRGHVSREFHASGPQPSSCRSLRKNCGHPPSGSHARSECFSKSLTSHYYFYFSIATDSFASPTVASKFHLRSALRTFLHP